MPQNKTKQKYIPRLTAQVMGATTLLSLGLTLLALAHPAPAQAASVNMTNTTVIVAEAVDVPVVKTYKQADVDKSVNGQCGGGDNAVKMAIDIGCKGLGNPIMDAVFAIIRFLTVGVGIVVIGSTIFAGIQFTTSRGDPNATGQAMKRISSNIAALLLFILTYAILNWLVPGTILR
jgi:hypothetical protein